MKIEKISQAVSYAAKNLPQGATVNIAIERHGYIVQLKIFDEDGSSQTIDVSEGTLIDDIIAATDNAKEYQG